MESDVARPSKQVAVKFPSENRATEVIDVTPNLTVRDVLTKLGLWVTHDLRNACPDRPALACNDNLFDRIEDGDLLYAFHRPDTS